MEKAQTAELTFDVETELNGLHRAMVDASLKLARHLNHVRGRGRLLLAQQVCCSSRKCCP